MPLTGTVVVYLPALNEAATIGAVLDGIPSTIADGVRVVKVVIDDGSRDETAAVARQHGARVVSHPANLGTGKAFVSGVNAGLRLGADAIVSMDADGQFRGEDVTALVTPVLLGTSDVVLCTRFRDNTLVGSMPIGKRLGNRLLTAVVNLVSRERHTDVSCGFRAISRDAALRVNIHSDFEYIHESLLNWSRAGLRIHEVSLPVLAERAVGKSRIVASISRYAIRSAPVLLRAVRDHSPLRFFGVLSVIVLVPALVMGLFVTQHWVRTGETAPYTSFITISVGGTVFAFLLATLALLADLIARLRLQVEELVLESRRTRFARDRDE